MKKIITLVFLVLISTNTFSQIETNYFESTTDICNWMFPF